MTRKTIFVFLAACILAPARVAAAASVAEQCAQQAEEGEDLRARHRLVDARARFLQCSREECPGVVRRDCGRWRSEVEQSLPSVVLSARTDDGEDLSDVRVLLDGAVVAEKLDGVALAVDPGPHVLRFERPGQPPIELRPLVREGEKNRIIAVAWGPAKAAPAPPPPPGPGPRTTPAGLAPKPQAAAPERPARDLTLVYALAGAGAATLGVAAYFEVRGISDWNHARSTCGVGRTCSPSEVDTVRTELWVGNIGFLVGLAALGGAGWVFFSRSAGPEVTLQVSPRAASVVGRF